MNLNMNLNLVKSVLYYTFNSNSLWRTADSILTLLGLPNNAIINILKGNNQYLGMLFFGSSLSFARPANR